MVSLACMAGSPSSAVAVMLSSSVSGSTSPEECAGKLLTPKVDPLGRESDLGWRGTRSLLAGAVDRPVKCSVEYAGLFEYSGFANVEEVGLSPTRGSRYDESEFCRVWKAHLLIPPGENQCLDSCGCSCDRGVFGLERRMEAAREANATVFFGGQWACPSARAASHRALHRTGISTMSGVRCAKSGAAHQRKICSCMRSRPSS